MNIKLRLTVMNFFQFFLWGAWLITFGAYAFNTLHFNGAQIGAIYGTLGIASLFMPGVTGIIADRWVNAERVYGTLHILGACMLYIASGITEPQTMFWVMLLNSMFYMPTIALANTVSYHILEKNQFNVVKDFPPIRVWGTIGFIVAMWAVSLAHFELNKMQLLIGSGASLFLGLYSFSLPACPPAKAIQSGSLLSALGLDALVLFKQKKMAIFFIFAMFLGAALQITNAFGDSFIHDFSAHPEYQNTLGVRYPAILMSISQISETLFILTIPFFLYKFGIKKVMLMSMLAWVLRFAFFGLGNPGAGLWLLLLSNIVYGCAFDFFNISGSLFVNMEADPKIRGSAQGLFMIMTNGLGATIGSIGSGLVIDHFTRAGVRDWPTIWFVFAGYALVVALFFIPIFQYKHNPQALENVQH